MSNFRSFLLSRVVSYVQGYWQWWQIHLDRIIIVLGVLGFSITILTQDSASLNSALKLNIGRSEALPIARGILNQEQGYNITEDYKSAALFSSNHSASMYFQRKLGIAGTKRLIAEQNIPMYNWSTRWFKPSIQEEFAVSLSTDTGKVTSFHHIIPESQPGKALEKNTALTIAQTYLKEQRGWNLQDWQSVSASSQDQPGGRRDHTFEWKRKEFKAVESELHLTIIVQGDRINYYHHWIKLPETYLREFTQERNLAGFIANFSGSLGSNLAIAIAGVAYVWAVMTGRRRWNQGWIVVAAVITLQILSELNGLPLSKMSYDTTENYFLFWMGQFYDIGMNAAIRSIPLFTMWTGGQEIAKLVWQGSSKILQAGTGDRKLDMARSVGRGFMLGGVSLGYMTTFYFLARHFGAWSPMPSGYNNIFSTTFPFLEALESGFLPGFSEESEARLVGISVMLWAFRRRSWALLIPGALWALAHLWYVADPFYLRGIELWIVATSLYGAAFLAFDLVTTIWAHATYNAMLSVGAAFQSGDRYLIFCGILVILILLSPTFPALWKFRSKTGSSTAPTPHITAILETDLPVLYKWDANHPWSIWFSHSELVAIALRWKGELIGWTIALPDIDNPRSAKILDLQVNPKYADRWGEGHQARHLFSVLQAKLQNLGITELYIESQNIETQQFWANQGWKPTMQTMMQADRPTHLDWNKVRQWPSKWRTLTQSTLDKLN